MIVHCPGCSARLEIPAPSPGLGATMVDCPVCGHEWIEANAQPVVNAPSSTMPEPETGLAGSDTGHLIAAARAARGEFLAARSRRRTRLVSWFGLVLLTVSPFAGALLMPERVVAAIPAAIKVYSWMGRDVNIYGLEIRHVDIQRLMLDGKMVIAVKGELANVSSSTRKIPWLRFALRTKDNAEVYHWTLDTEVRPLKPGESTGFVTRLASPPAASSDLEIRFARADEIGSNAGHD